MTGANAMGMHFLESSNRNVKFVNNLHKGGLFSPAIVARVEYAITKSSKISSILHDRVEQSNTNLN